MTFKDWLNKQTTERCDRIKNGISLLTKNYLFEELELKDGLSSSVQASDSHMCSPRETIKDESEYEEVEVYSHGVYVHELINYASETMFTYGYVPVEVMEELVEKHGGIKEN